MWSRRVCAELEEVCGGGAGGACVCGSGTRGVAAAGWRGSAGGGIVSAGWLGRVSVLGAAAEDGSSSRLLRVKAQTLLALTPDTSSGSTRHPCPSARRQERTGVV